MSIKNIPFVINGKEIGIHKAPYCIAEVGINHNGSLDVAKKMIEAAQEAGADAVKFKTFRAEDFCSPDQMFTYQSQGKQIKESMLEMFKRYELSADNWYEIRKH